jgi:hypothetical protein
LPRILGVRHRYTGMMSGKGLCESCRHLREVVSGRGSRFLLCLLSQSDKRFPKYPPQPVLKCGGYERRSSDHDPGEQQAPAR